MEGSDAQLPIFPYEDIVVATNDFGPENEIVPRSVYKGTLNDGREILVKRLPLMKRSELKEFVKDVKLWTRLDHSNVVNLFGFALVGDFLPLLVYEYVPSVTLEMHLSHATLGEIMQINWTKRYKIIEGTAKGITYLHCGFKNPIIIHGNIDPSNILLDGEGRTIIAGFSQAHQLDKDETIYMPVAEPQTRKYIAYIAPEYWRHGHLSRKADIFSFGVLSLELISGIRHQTYAKIEPASYLLDRAYILYKKNKIEEFMDATLEDPKIIQQVTKCIIIALLCVQGNSMKRPDMDTVVSLLAADYSIIKEMEIEIDKPRRLYYPIESNVSSQQPRQLHDVYQASQKATQNQCNESQEVAEEHQIEASREVTQNQHNEIRVVVEEHQIQASREATQNQANNIEVVVEEHQIQVERDEEYLGRLIASHNCIEFSYDTLVEATENFRIELGHGGFGAVYKGRYGEQDIAVKKPSNIFPGQRKIFLNEVRLLSRLKHRNVVQLVGHCIDGNQHLLVFEYIVNGTLGELLSDPIRREQELGWTRRYDIIKGIAAGLLYLHDKLPTDSIIHRDIKPANILLDDQFQPKIADFGLSRSLGVEETHVFTAAIGSWGYAAPEYCLFRHLSPLSDVYSFGVVVLEVVSGKRYYFIPSSPHVNALGLLDWAYKLYERDKTLDMMDPSLTNPKIHAQVKNCIQVALLCVQSDKKKRPSMQKVLSMLTLDKVTQKVSCRPGFYTGYKDNNIFRAIKRWFIQWLPLSSSSKPLSSTAA